MSRPWEDFWWESVTGPKMVVERTTAALSEGRTAVLRVPSDLSWRHSMRLHVRTSVEMKLAARDVTFEELDFGDDNPNRLAPAQYLLEKFMSAYDPRQMRRSPGDIRKLLTVRRILKNRLVWIKGLNDAGARAWVDYCRGFDGGMSLEETGLFVLEVRGADVAVPGPLAEIRVSDCIGPYDVQLFSSFVLDTKPGVSENWQRYISACAAAVCGIDAELAAWLLEQYDFREISLTDALTGAARHPAFVRRGEDADSPHVLHVFRAGNSDEIERRLWVAQIQVLFPLVEMERVNFVQKYDDPIRHALTSDAFYQYGERISDAMDAELGFLCWLMGNWKEGSGYVLYVSDESERNRLHFLHGCRNRLAHMKCCAPETVRRLLDEQPILPS